MCIRDSFIDQSQSLNLFLEGATMAKLTSMHFYAWKSGLKTGMYYLRTKSAVDAKKVTITREVKAEPVAEVQEVAVDNVAQKQQIAAETAAKFAKQTAEKVELATPVKVIAAVEVEPMSADEMKALIAQAKEAEGDDCLMCGS